jgi:tetratricopeptide (TPR) repeat protein
VRSARRRLAARPPAPGAAASPALSRRTATLATRSGLALALLALLGLALALRGAVSPGPAALLHGLVAAAGLTAASASRLGPAPGAALALAAGWPLLGLLSLGWSASPDATLDASAALCAGAVVFLLAGQLAAHEERRRLVAGLALAGAVVALLALAVAPAGARARFPFGNPNHLGGWLLLPGALAFMGLLSTEVAQRGRREAALLWFGCVAVTGAGIAASASRGAGLAAAAALSALWLARRVGPRRGAVLAAVCLAAGAAALAALPLLAPDLLGARSVAGESSAGIRWAVYGAAARAALDGAPLGTGLGAFPAAFASRRPPHLPYAVGFAHSEPLHAWVELGTPFVVAILATLLAMVRCAAARLGAGSSSLAWGAALALVALAAHSLVDFPLHVPAIALTGAALAGILFAGSPGPASSPALTRGALAALALTTLALSGSQGLAVLAEERSDARLAAGDFTGALRAAERGFWVRPARPGLHARVARAAEHAFRFGGCGRACLARALAARQQAVSASPADAGLRLALARSALLAGDVAGAEAELAVAARLDPASPVPLLARARLRLARGEEAEAAAELRAALQRHPAAAAPATAAWLRATRAPALLESVLPGEPAAWRAGAAALAREGFLREAAQAWARAFDASPDDLDAALRAARHFVRAGDRAAAENVLARALERAPDDPVLGDLLARLRSEAAPRQRSEPASQERG